MVVVPPAVLKIIDKLKISGFQAFIVGGSIRDYLLDQRAKDFDIATSAKPEEVESLFEKVVKTGEKFGSVMVINEGIKVEVTTFRKDITRGRHPEVQFTDNLNLDLARRDFTINAMAADPLQKEIIDPFNGCKDLRRHLIRTVGNPHKRFNEDPLRMLRAVRFACSLGFDIEPETLAAIEEQSYKINEISKERIRDELVKFISKEGIMKLKEVGLLKYILPELEECYQFDQNNPHPTKDVFMHTLAVLERVKDENLILKLAALLHDIGKPSCFSLIEGEGHFYGHEKVSAVMAEGILKRLRFDNKIIERIVIIVRNHMFQNIPKKSSVKRLINKVGWDNIFLLLKLRSADILGSGKKSRRDLEDIKKIHKIVWEIRESEEALAVKDLAVNGYDVMKVCNIGPSPEVGRILKELLEYVLEDSARNKKDILIDKIKALHRKK